jgi:hypothetical protein
MLWIMTAQPRWPSDFPSKASGFDANADQVPRHSPFPRREVEHEATPDKPLI